MHAPNTQPAQVYVFAGLNRSRTSPPSVLVRQVSLYVATAIALFLGGCTTPRVTEAAPPVQESSAPQTLHVGDVIRISFPGAPTLDTTQQIRRDGKINLTLIGEIAAADVAPSDLEKRLAEKYAEQLVSKEVRVTVVSSAFAVYVAGAVLRPGRIAPDREVTPIEAVMEAGGFDPQKANLKAVSIIRREGTQTKSFVVNLQAVLEGRQTDQFYLKANDIIYVPERHSIF
jgi:polysaccharide export outer membrane protein